MKKYNYFLTVCILLGFSFQVSALKEPPAIHFVVKQFVVTGNNPLSASKTQSILADFIGEHDGLEALQFAAEKLETALKLKGYAFYRVTLVPQALTEGIITLHISEFKIDQILIEGNKHYSNTNILNSAPSLKKGETPNTLVLSRAINIANASPTKHITLQFSESKNGGAIDAKLLVKDNKPNFYTLSLNNTGSDATGIFRLTGAYKLTNLLDADHNLSLSYTISPDNSGAVSQFGLIYSIPYYASGARVDISLSSSNVDSGVVGDFFDVSGKGTVISLHYNKTFLQAGAYKQEVNLGLDYKKFEDEVLFLGGGANANNVVSQPLSAAYKGSYLSSSGQWGFGITLFSNLAGGSNNEDADYALNRTENIIGVVTAAKASWSKINYNLSYLYFIKANWLARLNISGQETSDLLITGEQFGIGGANSIRGYNEREVLGDKGYQLNLELWLPPVTKYELRPIFFYDQGHVEFIVPATEQNPASYGAGLRWSMRDNINVVLDIGVVSKAAGTAIKGDSRGHLSVNFSFY